ncbi:CoA-binding protein, partial [Kaarinaea lacus]
MSSHYLDALFSPNTIAVFGASEKPMALGTIVYQNIIDAGFKGDVYAINPKHNKVSQRPCFASLEQTNSSIDLALITTPAATVVDIIHQCGEHGVKAAIIFSAGFGDGKANNTHLQTAVLEQTKKYGIRLLGPNCLGLIRTPHHINATFSKNNAQPGSLALVSQSGALCTAILDWAAERNIGFSSVVSLGAAADIDFGDILDYLALDPHTKSILLYVEGIRNARLFMSSLRVAARLKPVVVLKTGRHEEGSRAA